MSDELNQPKIKNAMEYRRTTAYSQPQESLEFTYNQEKLEEENRYRVKGDAFPQKLEIFNWGAFLLPAFWGPFNGNPKTLWIIPLMLVPYIGLICSTIFQFYCGIHGNEWAWEKKQWASLEVFHEVQKNWAIAGIIFCILQGVLVGLIVANTLGLLLTQTN